MNTTKRSPGCRLYAVAAIPLLCFGIGQATDLPKQPSMHVSTVSPHRCAATKNQLALTSCLAELARNAEERETNQHLKLKDELGRNSTADVVAAFESAEARWRDYRDAECGAAESLYAGGSAAPAVNSDCRIRLAEQRILELQKAFVAKEGQSSK
jgi:uncharacterized protein YecT (DUF1311 family)